MKLARTALAGLAVATLALTACSSGSDGGSDAPAADSLPGVVAVSYTHLGLRGVEIGDRQLDVVDAVVQRFGSHFWTCLLYTSRCV